MRLVWCHRLATWCAAGLLLATLGDAQANAWFRFGDQSEDCNWFVAGEATPRMAVVHPMAQDRRTHFLKLKGYSDTSCSEEAPCAKDSYLVTGDEVVVTSSSGEYTCAHLMKVDGTVVSGFVAAPDLSFMSDSSPMFGGSDGFGKWIAASATITIAEGNAGYVLVEGDAWLGPPKNRTGRFEGIAFLDLEKRTAGYDSDHYAGTAAAVDNAPVTVGCRVRFRPISSEYMVVDDNELCGGQGVSFTDLYRKQK